MKIEPKTLDETTALLSLRTEQDLDEDRSKWQSLWEIKKPLRLKINTVENVQTGISEAFGSTNKPFKIYTTVAVYQYETLIGEVKSTDEFPYHGGNSVFMMHFCKLFISLAQLGNLDRLDSLPITALGK